MILKLITLGIFTCTLGVDKQVSKATEVFITSDIWFEETKNLGALENKNFVDFS